MIGVKRAVVLLPVKVAVMLVSLLIVNAPPVDKLATLTQAPAPVILSVHCHTFPMVAPDVRLIELYWPTVGGAVQRPNPLPLEHVQ